MKKKNLIERLYRWGCLAGMVLLFLPLVSCTEEVLDYEHPDVELFVKQLKDGELVPQSPDGMVGMPKFTIQDIEKLLEHADDLSVIPSFPLAPVSYSAGGKLGCKMVHVDAENYEGIYFLSDEEVQDAVLRYRHWWENRKLPRTMWTIDPCWNEPLCGSGYMWW